ncbi:MAG: cobalamin biosynthesis protein [Dehalococcoidia bacterium]
MTCALVALNVAGARTAERIGRGLPGSELYLLEGARREDTGPGATGFDSLSELVGRIFPRYSELVFIMALGIVVRVVAPHLRDKHSDPAVVVVDEGNGFAISLLSGHEGGANDLSLRVANACGARPVITTASEARKPLIVGIGARRGVEQRQVTGAVKEALALAGRELPEVRWLATIDLKEDEPGLLAAGEELGIPLRIISREAVGNFRGDYSRSPRVEQLIGVEGVCEPCALLAGNSPRLILPRRNLGGVMVAIAEESSM